ncbi:hypothetical protein PPSIR1_36182 [Plesiocystis pacifica SIR-1]|uniref:DUF4126 domain-containing protein n=1 Tax=Plesiocystis pacifica SIR-1 TaxID=391625 RepID=A6G1E1_9BACT|nr:hypothetical protein PPSIR1_36182 [Plesiocystis pacifica SIR-1]
MIPEALARLLAASSLAGTRAGLTLFGLALAARLGVISGLGGGSEWMSSNVGLGILLALVVVEELAEQDEDLQALVDLFAYALRGGAGALAASSIQAATVEGVAGFEQVAALPDLPDWGAVVLGAALAVATHHLRAQLHEQLSGLGDSLLSPRTWLAWLELGGVLGLLAAVIFAPALALAFVVLAAVLGLVAVLVKRGAEDRLNRRDCASPDCKARPRVEASVCPRCRTPLRVERELS